MDNIKQAAELGRSIIAEHLIQGGPGDPEALETAATLCNFAPAMLDALRSIARDDDGDAMLDAAGMDRIAAILARIDGTPTAQPAGAIGEAGAGVWRIITGTHCAELLYWSNADGWGSLASSDAFTQAERESLNLPIGGQWWFDSDSPDECQTCTEATETRAFPCDECGHSDEYGDA